MCKATNECFQKTDFCKKSAQLEYLRSIQDTEYDIKRTKCFHHIQRQRLASTILRGTAILTTIQ